ncbi:OLC1v1017747C1 [Oldenlandia corymbosa var. corymbosa]|uniref:OLC1v1017747C1 n=1 Tax=Oldenlandia corymbosa var. corymbosa TaxID=529605 RepID=A0AAV1EA60_OLDCO|nr:OLC1v1017747C1 [Oldenlandia corymbosa var. corymbosa]
MINELFHISILLSTVIIFSSLCFRKRKPREKSPVATNNYDSKGKILPPGGTGWPLIGETLDYFSKVKQGIPQKFVMDRMNKYSSKVFRTSLIGESVAILGNNAEGNKFLFSNEKKLVQVWWPSSVEKIFATSENNKSTNEYLKGMRKLFPLILKPDVLVEHIGKMDDVVKQHFQTYWKCKEAVINVGEMSKKCIFSVACNLFLGINDAAKIDQLEKIVDEVATGLHSMPIDLPGTALNRGIKASKHMRKIVETMVRQRKHDYFSARQKISVSEVDFMSRLIQARDENGENLKEEDIISVLVGLMEGGYATLHNTITVIMYQLAEFPDVYNLVLTEQKEIAKSKETGEKLSWEDLRKMKYSWNVVCEVLRILPPGIGSFKEAITDFSYEGYTIPKGWKIHWIFHSTHKNPEYFPNPESFDPSRFQGDGPIPYTFVPFGGGSRMCPGNEYARVAMLIFMHNAVTKFRWEKFIPSEGIIYYPYPRPAQGLPIRLHPHNL